MESTPNYERQSGGRTRRADAPGRHIARLSHIAVYRNSELEVQLADERPLPAALHNLHERMRDVIVSSSRGGRRTDLLGALDETFASAGFPFARSRAIPRLVVDVSTPEGIRLDVSRRRVSWSDEEKLALVAHGRQLTEDALEAWPHSGRPAPEATAA